MHRFNAEKLGELMAAELVSYGTDPISVHHVVASLVQTSLRGVDSHGINLFPHYCRATLAGRVNKCPQINVKVTGGATAIVNADHAFGHHAGAVAMGRAISLALESGMGAVSVNNSTHFGAAAYFALMAPEQDCLGFAFTNADALVKAFGAREAFFGTNPFCFTAPMEIEEPFCLDMATSQVSWNKINNYRRENLEIPDGWAFDVEGHSVTDSRSAWTLNPAGGYKGFGLGMMIDILCALLAEGRISKEIVAMYEEPLDDTKRGISHFFMALDIARFTDPAIFKRSLQSMAARVRALTPLENVDGVMIAGDPEKASLAQRIQHGIPVDEVKYAEFLNLSPKFAEAVVS